MEGVCERGECLAGNSKLDLVGGEHHYLRSASPCLEVDAQAESRDTLQEQALWCDRRGLQVQSVNPRQGGDGKLPRRRRWQHRRAGCILLRFRFLLISSPLLDMGREPVRSALWERRREKIGGLVMAVNRASLR